MQNICLYVEVLPVRTLLSCKARTYLQQMKPACKYCIHKEGACLQAQASTDKYAMESTFSAVFVI